MAERTSTALLTVEDLRTWFYTEEGVVKAVDGVSFSVTKGRVLGIVGESGSGKSIASLSIMRLIPMPPGRIVSGGIYFHEQDLLKLNTAQMRRIRGNSIAMIFQEPMTSLNPVMRVGKQISEALRLHQGLSKQAAKEKAITLLDMVRIPNPDKRYNDFPHQMSGGMRQRVMIAMALSCEPELLICDEPTTALDVTIQAQILDLINEMKEEYGSAVMMITHDMGVIAETADDVAVMYTGRIMEYAAVDAVFEEPLHPYTKGLLQSVPKLNQRDEKLSSIRGVVPKATAMPTGCPFHPRCDVMIDRCVRECPPPLPVAGRQVACWLYASAGESVEVHHGI